MATLHHWVLLKVTRVDGDIAVAILRSNSCIALLWVPSWPIYKVHGEWEAANDRGSFGYRPSEGVKL